MKKLLFVPLAITAGFAQSQITLDASDFASVGDSMFVVSDIEISTINVGAASTSAQTWDFVSFNIDGHETYHFVSPANAPGGSSFSNANVALLSGTSSTFFNKGTDSVIVYGNGGSAQGFSLSATYVPAYNILKFPVNLGDTISASSSFDETEYFGIDTVALSMTIKLDSIRFTREFTIETEFDAFGTLKLPMGDFETLRSYNKQTNNDSIYLYLGAPISLLSLTAGWNTLTPQTLNTINGLAPGLLTGQRIGVYEVITYDWYAKAEGFRIASLTMNDAGTAPSRVDYKSNPLFLSTSSAELLPNAFVFPNPANDFVAISGVEAGITGTLRVVDYTGKTVISTRYNGQNQISVSELAAGNYYISLVNENNQLVFGDKFQVVK